MDYSSSSKLGVNSTYTTPTTTNPPPSYTGSGSPIQTNPWRSNGFDPIIVGVVFIIFIMIIILAFIKSRSAPESEIRRRNAVVSQKRDGLDEETISSSGKVIENEGKEGECIVCLVDYAKGDVLRTLNVCGHYFHKDCIDAWFKTNSSCPICRTSLRPDHAIPASVSPTITENLAASGLPPAVEPLERRSDEVSSLAFQTSASPSAANPEPHFPHATHTHETGSPNSTGNQSDGNLPGSRDPLPVLVSVSPPNYDSLEPNSQSRREELEPTDFVVIDLSHGESSSRNNERV